MKSDFLPTGPTNNLDKMTWVAPEKIFILGDNSSPLNLPFQQHAINGKSNVFTMELTNTQFGIDFYAPS